MLCLSLDVCHHACTELHAEEEAALYELPGYSCMSSITKGKLGLLMSFF